MLTFYAFILEGVMTAIIIMLSIIIASFRKCLVCDVNL